MCLEAGSYQKRNILNKNLKFNSDNSVNINLPYIVVWFSPVQLNFQFPKEENKEMLDIGSCVVLLVCLQNSELSILSKDSLYSYTQIYAS